MKTISVNKLTDEELVFRIAETNSSELFAILYDRFSNVVYNKCYGFSKSKEEAEDLTHDVFIRLFVKLKTFRGNSKFSTWLYSFTYNFCVNYVQRNAHKKKESVTVVTDLIKDKDVFSLDTRGNLSEVELERLKHARELPMFTAQTGMDCTGCHTQHMPRLNKFGRKFAASGFTMSQQIKDVDAEEMDINPSLLIKSKYARTYDKPDGHGDIKVDDTNDGEISVVRMATLYLGGRLTENIGGTLNLGWRKEEGDSIYGKITYAKPIEDGFWGITGYSNPSQGPFSGMEFYNTGLYKPLRTFDMRVYSNAIQSAKIGAQGATGVQAYYDKDSLLAGGDHLFVTAGIYAAAQDNRVLDMTDNILPFARIAYEYPIGDYNVMIGGFIISGGDTVSPTDELSMKKETYGMDIQIEGEIADKEASLIFTKVFKNEVTFTGIDSQSDELDTEDIYNDSFSVEGTYSITPEFIGKLAYMNFNDRYEYDKSTKVNVKDLDYAINVGVDYGFTVTNTSMKLAVEYAWMEPSLSRVENYESFMATLTLPF